MLVPELERAFSYFVMRKTLVSKHDFQLSSATLKVIGDKTKNSMNILDDSEEKSLEVVKRASDGLLEHFDTVQIFVSRYSPEIGTETVHWGGGDWFSRYGLIKDWIRKREAE